MSDYEFYFTIFHGVLGFVSFMGIVYLSAKSEKVIKIYPKPIEQTLFIMHHEYYKVEIFNRQCHTGLSASDPYKHQHVNMLKEAFAKDLMEFITIDEITEPHNFYRDGIILRASIKLAVRKD